MVTTTTSSELLLKEKADSRLADTFRRKRNLEKLRKLKDWPSLEELMSSKKGRPKQSTIPKGLRKPLISRASTTLLRTSGKCDLLRERGSKFLKRISTN